MAETVVIPRRFTGPPGAGNGGYSCGRFAALIGGQAEVTLRKPVPVETPLLVRRQGDSVQVFDQDQLIADVAAADLSEIVPPAPVTLEQAVLGAAGFPLAGHPFPTCFVCGSRRENIDGLRIHSYRVPGTDVVASPWVPNPEFADAAGHVVSEIVWASLDCPTGWAGLSQTPKAASVVGRLAVRIDAPVFPQRVYIAVARETGREGRKMWAVGGLYTADGKLCAASRATWIRMAR